MDYNDYSDQIQDLGNRYMKEGARAWERYAKVVSEASTGKWNAEGTQERYLRFAQTSSADFMQKLMQCNVDYYVGLVNAGLNLSNQTLDAILQSTDTGATPPGEDSAIPPSRKAAYTEIHFSGKSGETSSQAFVVANRQVQDVEVSFEVSEFISEDGKTRMRIPVTFEPEQFVLKPGEEKIVECQVTYDEALAPNQRHHALARVVGFPDMMLRLVLTSEDS